jgi:hypothetical protein
MVKQLMAKRPSLTLSAIRKVGSPANGAALAAALDSGIPE